MSLIQSTRAPQLYMSARIVAKQPTRCDVATGWADTDNSLYIKKTKNRIHHTSTKRKMCEMQKPSGRLVLGETFLSHQHGHHVSPPHVIDKKDERGHAHSTRCVQGNLAHNKTPTSLGPPYDPRHRPTVGSWEGAFFCK